MSTGCLLVLVSACRGSIFFGEPVVTVMKYSSRNPTNNHAARFVRLGRISDQVATLRKKKGVPTGAAFAAVLLACNDSRPFLRQTVASPLMSPMMTLVVCSAWRTNKYATTTSTSCFRYPSTRLDKHQETGTRFGRNLIVPLP